MHKSMKSTAAKGGANQRKVEGMEELLEAFALLFERFFALLGLFQVLSSLILSLATANAK